VKPAGVALVVMLAAALPTRAGGQGIGLGQLQAGAAAPNAAYGGGVTLGGRGALGFRTGGWVFGVDGGLYGVGGAADLAVLGGFARVGRRDASGLCGVVGLGYQGPGYADGGRASLFGANLGVGWSGGSGRRSGWSIQGSYLVSLQHDQTPTSTAVVLTVGREWRW